MSMSGNPVDTLRLNHSKYLREYMGTMGPENICAQWDRFFSTSNVFLAL